MYTALLAPCVIHSRQRLAYGSSLCSPSGEPCTAREAKRDRQGSVGRGAPPAATPGAAHRAARSAASIACRSVAPRANTPVADTIVKQALASNHPVSAGAAPRVVVQAMCGPGVYRQESLAQARKLGQGRAVRNRLRFSSDIRSGAPSTARPAIGRPVCTNSTA